jgi:hypothetical protein
VALTAFAVDERTTKVEPAVVAAAHGDLKLPPGGWGIARHELDGVAAGAHRGKSLIEAGPAAGGAGQPVVEVDPVVIDAEAPQDSETTNRTPYLRRRPWWSARHAIRSSKVSGEGSPTDAQRPLLPSRLRAWVRVAGGQAARTASPVDSARVGCRQRRAPSRRGCATAPAGGRASMRSASCATPRSPRSKRGSGSTLRHSLKVAPVLSPAARAGVGDGSHPPGAGGPARR